jgi:ribonucleotide reductase alpha subunit
MVFNTLRATGASERHPQQNVPKSRLIHDATSGDTTNVTETGSVVRYLDVAVDDVHAVQVLDAARNLQQHLRQHRMNE